MVVEPGIPCLLGIGTVNQRTRLNRALHFEISLGAFCYFKQDHEINLAEVLIFKKPADINEIMWSSVLVRDAVAHIIKILVLFVILLLYDFAFNSVYIIRINKLLKAVPIGV